MIECPSCKHSEFVGTLYCSECGTRLVHTAPIGPGGEFIKFEGPDTNNGPPLGPGLAAGAIFGLRVLKTGDMVSLAGRDNYTLGRSAGSQAIVPDVDLDIYGAQDQGISRLHAEIRLDQSGVHVVDLDSVNGTLINGKRIEPQVPHELRNKDIVQLGHMQLQVISRIRG
ncbi:MAG: FHA domain-containing protein [Anaerolineales bacterium]